MRRTHVHVHVDIHIQVVHGSQNGYMYSLNYSLHQFTHINMQKNALHFLATGCDPTTVLSLSIVQGRQASLSCDDLAHNLHY